MFCLFSWTIFKIYSSTNFFSISQTFFNIHVLYSAIALTIYTSATRLNDIIDTITVLILRGANKSYDAAKGRTVDAIPLTLIQTHSSTRPIVRYSHLNLITLLFRGETEHYNDQTIYKRLIIYSITGCLIFPRLSTTITYSSLSQFVTPVY